MHTLGTLRKHAELSLCEKCYPVYLHQMEPWVEAMVREYFYDWQGIESYARGLVLWDMGAFKTHLFLDDFDEFEPEEVTEFLHLDKYKVFFEKYPSIKRRLGYLHDKKIIGDNLFNLLIELNKRRNKVHRVKGELSEITRSAFTYGSSWLQSIYVFSVDTGTSTEARERIFQDIETSADRLLARLHAAEAENQTLGK
jgi:hypothetical protein